MIVFTTYEKNEFIDKSIDSLTEHIFQNTNDRMLFFKVLVNFIEKTNNQFSYSSLSEQVLDDGELLKVYYQEILKYMADIAAAQQVEVIEYSTGDLAKYFGVSITTINNWIKDGRFLGYKRNEINEHARIKGNTLWKAKTGKAYPVQEIVDEWVKDNLEANQNDENEKVFLINQVAAFDIKYKGSFEQTLGKKHLREMTAQEESDASVWKYLLKRLNDEYGL